MYPRLVLFAETGFYPYDIGGPSTVAYAIAYKFLEKGNLALVIKKPRYVTIRSIRNFLKNKFGKIPEIIAVDKIPDVRLLNRIIKTVKEADIVHFNSPPITPNSFFIPLYTYLRKIALTCTIHGGIFWEPLNFLYIPLQDYFKRILHFFSRIIVLNEFYKLLLIKKGIPKDKMLIIPNGVDASAILNTKAKKLEGEPAIIFTGRLSKIKGIDILIKAFRKFNEKYKEARLYIVGDGTEKYYLQRLVEDLDLSNNVHFVGYKPSFQVYEYLKGAHIFVLPSYYENFSISLLEAMIAGIPIIASNNPGNLSVLKGGKLGFLFEVGNIDSLYKTIMYVAENYDEAVERAKFAQRYALNNYDINIISEKYFNLFKEILIQTRRF